ncbi:MAG TPA: AraC family transcriptional regulator [Steroidobacteraceae bacterium]|nr:AraC family transcriptional regulator [Steroidobacteraceae bacterium]
MTPKKRVKNTYGIDDEVAAAADAARGSAYIEAHLFDDLSVTNIASACAVSAYHFSRRFSRRQGESVMSYIRGRRLDVAAKRLLTEPALALVELALDCRFESHAAFTRAFSKAFGMSPNEYRRTANPGARKRRITIMKPRLETSVERIDTFHVAGLSGKFDPSNYIRVSELWKQFVGKMGFEGRLGDGETMGVFRDRDFSIGSFEHLAGARIAPGLKPDDLEVWTLPGREYLVFKQLLVEGELHPQVAAAQAEIWTTGIAQSGRKLARAPDFQIYPANFKVGPGGWLAYYVPLDGD